MDQQGIVIVGAGAAGLSAATTMRTQGYEGPITVVNGEPHSPYNRTLVNKAVLSGLLTPQRIAQPEAQTLEAELVQGRVTSVDTERSVVRLDEDRFLPYAALIAATGSAPRPDSRVTATSQRVFHLHTVDDATRLHEQLRQHPNRLTVTVLGAGFIGAETASYLVGTGAHVHLVSRSTTPLASALGGPIAQRITELHRAHVTTHFGRDVTALVAGPTMVTVTLSDGHTVESDLVVVAHGTHPVSAWLTGGEDGLAVDSHLRAHAHRRVYAAGSVALHAAGDGQRYRVDHWDAATAQGAHAARAVLHDLIDAQDPGPYIPTTGFTLALYRHAAAAYGVVAPGTHERQHDTGTPEATLTSFHRSDGAMTAIAGLDAFQHLFAARSQLAGP